MPYMELVFGNNVWFVWRDYCYPINPNYVICNENVYFLRNEVKKILLNRRLLDNQNNTLGKVIGIFKFKSDDSVNNLMIECWDDAKVRAMINPFFHILVVG